MLSLLHSYRDVSLIPNALAPQVLKLAQEMDFKEHSMYAYIEKLKSIEEAVAKFGRLCEILASRRRLVVYEVSLLEPLSL